MEKIKALIQAMQYEVRGRYGNVGLNMVPSIAIAIFMVLIFFVCLIRVRLKKNLAGERVAEKMADLNNSLRQNGTNIVEAGKRNIKKCPFCAEEILTDAQKCRHCGEWLKEKREDNGKERKLAGVFGAIGFLAFIMSNLIPAITAPIVVLAAIACSVLEMALGSAIYGVIVLILSIIQIFSIAAHFSSISSSF